VNLLKLRKENNATQKDIATYLGCSDTVYSRYERGVREPSIEILIKLADYYHTTIDYLVGRGPKPRDPLTEYEEELLDAANKADQRARDDALAMLRAHEVPKKKEDTA